MRMIHNDEEEDARVSMTPLIDLVFILMVYFLLTMTFVPDEQWLGSLLERGGTGAATTFMKEQINVVFIPAAVPGTQSSRELQHWYETHPSPGAVTCRINGHELHLDQSQTEEQQLQRIHDFIVQQLQMLELSTATRAQQERVVLHCFERLPWRYALAGYDAVRAYEEGRGGLQDQKLQRQFDFAPSELRHTHAYALGQELLRLRSLH